jgi:hypothetical protein
VPSTPKRSRRWTPTRTAPIAAEWGHRAAHNIVPATAPRKATPVIATGTAPRGPSEETTSAAKLSAIEAEMPAIITPGETAPAARMQVTTEPDRAHRMSPSVLAGIPHLMAGSVYRLAGAGGGSAEVVCGGVVVA